MAADIYLRASLTENDIIIKYKTLEITIIIITIRLMIYR